MKKKVTIIICIAIVVILALAALQICQFPAGFQQHFHTPSAIDGHDLVTDVVVRRVKRDRERELGPELHQLVDLRHDAAGGQAHVAKANLNALRLPQQPQELHHVVVIIKGFPRSHQNHI